MTARPLPSFESVVATLNSRLQRVVAEFVREHGIELDVDAYLRQASRADEWGLKELVIFGMDIWPLETDDEGGVHFPTNIVSFQPKAVEPGTSEMPLSCVA